MTEEPEFISQTCEPMTPEQKRDWFSARKVEAEANGATWHRYSYDQDNHDQLLYEGWKVRPKDEGPLRFQMTAP